MNVIENRKKGRITIGRRRVGRCVALLWEAIFIFPRSGRVLSHHTARVHLAFCRLVFTRVIMAVLHNPPKKAMSGGSVWLTQVTASL